MITIGKVRRDGNGGQWIDLDTETYKRVARVLDSAGALLEAMGKLAVDAGKKTGKS